MPFRNSSQSSHPQTQRSLLSGWTVSPATWEPWSSPVLSLPFRCLPRRQEKDCLGKLINFQLKPAQHLKFRSYLSSTKCVGEAWQLLLHILCHIPYYKCRKHCTMAVCSSTLAACSSCFEKNVSLEHSLMQHCSTEIKPYVSQILWSLQHETQKTLYINNL